MKLYNFIEGLKTLQPYYDSDGFHIGAEHDQFFAYTTDRPLSIEDIEKMFELGWFQPEAEDDGNDENKYDPDSGWSATL